MTTPGNVARTCAALHTRKVARKVTRIFDEALRPIGLKITQFTLLVAINEGAPDSITELADMLGIERSTLSRSLQLLEKEGWVAVNPEGARRMRALHLTKAGRELLKRALPRWEGAQRAIEHRVGQEHWAQTRRYLTELDRAL